MIGWSMACSKPASSRLRRSTTGICRRRCKIGAAGPTAIPWRAFTEYADVVVRRLGDRVKHWITHNEPWCVAFLGNWMGEHAPGLRNGPALAVAHNVLLSHGEAVPVLRAGSPGAQVGITLNFSPAYPASESEADRAAAHRHDGFFNRWFLDPLYGRGYPADMLEIYGDMVPEITPGDLERIAVPTDFLGVNFYNRAVIRDDPAALPLRTGSVEPARRVHPYELGGLPRRAARAARAAAQRLRAAAHVYHRERRGLLRYADRRRRPRPRAHRLLRDRTWPPAPRRSTRACRWRATSPGR